MRVNFKYKVSPFFLIGDNLSFSKMTIGTQNNVTNFKSFESGLLEKHYRKETNSGMLLKGILTLNHYIGTIILRN